jgi:hypothetical protein
MIRFKFCLQTNDAPALFPHPRRPRSAELLAPAPAGTGPCAPFEIHIGLIQALLFLVLPQNLINNGKTRHKQLTLFVHTHLHIVGSNF